MSNLSHLSALQVRLSNERVYLSNAKTEKEKVLRKVWISQIEKEIACEKKFTGVSEIEPVEMSDEELLSQLLA